MMKEGVSTLNTNFKSPLKSYSGWTIILLPPAPPPPPRQTYFLEKVIFLLR